MVRWIALLLPLALLTVPACQVAGVTGSGKIVTESRDVSGFMRVSVAGVGSVVLVQGADEGVVVETDDNLMKYVSTEVRDGVLYLGTSATGKSVNLKPSKETLYTVTFKNLDGIAVSGAGDVTADAIATPALDIAVSGAGDISIADLRTQKLGVAVSGAGDITLSGEAPMQEVAISGAGAYKAGELRSAVTEIAISGTGDATVWATDRLKAEVSGIGSVSYYGEPAVERSVSGVGSVTALGMHGTSI
jgi:hypothetical protein